MTSFCLLLLALIQAPSEPFRITVVDAATGRGVPLVELETVHHLSLWTDSAGVVAFDEPGLLGRRVFFHVRSPGYRFPADGFGYAGVALDTRPGGAARLEIERLQIAERLYRMTGQGRYVHSVRLGLSPPLEAPLLAGGVLGQDSVQVAPWEGGLFWIWGDTARAAYPLGNFAASGARSALPGRGGLDPGVGVDLHYLTGPDGFCRPLCPLEGPGPVWLDALCALPDAQGRPWLLCHYVRVKDLGTLLEQGLAEWDAEAEVFRPVRRLPLDAPLHPLGHPLRIREGEKEYLLCANPFPLVRLPATREAFLDPARWEAFTCLEPGSAWDPQEPRVERDAAGQVVWGWKAGTAWVDPRRQAELVRRGLLARAERWLVLRDPDEDREVLLHSGSLHWNAFRRRWIVLAVEQGGSDSFLGEVWFAEADTPTGPWAFARKVATHPRYSFYNPFHHPWFDEDGGRRIYFEGTYATTFSGNPRPVPRYDYNQLMYGLDLADPRLRLPEAVYRLRDGSLARRADPARIAELAFFARPGEDGEGARRWPRPTGVLVLERADPVPLAAW